MFPKFKFLKLVLCNVGQIKGKDIILKLFELFILALKISLVGSAGQMGGKGHPSGGNSQCTAGATEKG